MTVPGILRKAPFLLIAIAALAFGQPAVDAGDDQIDISLPDAVSGSMRLMGDVSEPYDSVRWTQTTGTTATITNPKSPITAVALPDTGGYMFKLRAYLDGLSAVDSVRMTVRPNLPFVILAPANGEQVKIGEPFMIRWQMDPSVGCVIYYSLDSGITNNLLNTGGGVSDSILWDVPSDIPGGTEVIIKVMEYTSQPDRLTTYSHVTLVDSVLSARSNYERSWAGPFRIILTRSGALKLPGVNPETDRSIAVCDVRGRLLCSFGSAQAARKVPTADGFFVYRTDLQFGKVMLAQ